MENIYIITGTSRGLGKALTDSLAKDNNYIFASARKIPEFNQNSKYINFHHVNLAETNNLTVVIDSIFSQINLNEIKSITLINNAGVLNPIKSIQNASLEEISNNIDVNIKAIIILTSLFLAKTEKANIPKTIVNISSGAATHPYDGWSTYCASKAAVDLFTECVGLEQTRQKFPATVISFYPGVIDTDMQAQIRASDVNDFPSLAKFIDRKNNGELLAPSFVAETLIKFLQSAKLENGKTYDIKNLPN